MREWEKISNPIARACKLRLIAFDPDVVLGDTEYKTRVELPVEFAQKLCKIIAERNSLRRKVKELERRKSAFWLAHVGNVKRILEDEITAIEARGITEASVGGIQEACE